MSTNPRKAQACTGKIRHHNRADAHAHVGRLIASGAAAGTYHTYRCRNGRRGCGGWHVGHRGHHFKNNPTR